MRPPPAGRIFGRKGGRQSREIAPAREQHSSGPMKRAPFLNTGCFFIQLSLFMVNVEMSTTAEVAFRNAIPYIFADVICCSAYCVSMCSGQILS